LIRVTKKPAIAGFFFLAMASNLWEDFTETLTMRRLIISIITLLACLNTASVAAEIYKTVDKNGHVTYTDTPPPNTSAKPVELKSLNTTPAITPGPEYTPPAAPIDPEGYSLNLLAPENGKTLMPNERSVMISVNLNPALQDDDLLAYKLDGKVIAKTNETSYNLVEPPRGEHSISVAVVDRKDQELAQSDAVTLMVMRPPIKQQQGPVPKK
jgi:hypothetical protein